MNSSGDGIDCFNVGGDLERSMYDDTTQRKKTLAGRLAATWRAHLHCWLLDAGAAVNHVYLCERFRCDVRGQIHARINTTPLIYYGSSMLICSPIGAAIRFFGERIFE